uniref:Disks large homolog 1 n=1 Tax=Panagrellus redivivus TaxID=6233 RepID=A0A7E4ZZ59_PANRE
MPPHKSGEVHRALERLEEYHAELNRPSDAELKHGIEKVIGIFKSRLFQALCDIQDFYDNILLNDRIPLEDKSRETKRLAERWETNPPFGVSGGGYKSPLDSISRPLDPISRPYTSNGYDDLLGGRASATGLTSTGLGTGVGLGTTGLSTALSGGNVSSQSQYTFHEARKELVRDGWATSEYTTRTVDGPTGAYTQTTSTTGHIDEHGVEWEIHDIVIEKNKTGLGFSISGGRDRSEPDNHNIVVTEISKGGAVARDGRVLVNDIILKVNNTDCVGVDHQVAVDALKNSGPVVRLLVKRRKPARSVSQSNLNSDYRYPGTTGFSTSAGQYTPSVPQPTTPTHVSPPVTIPVQRVPYAIQLLESDPKIQKAELTKGPNGLGFSVAGGVGNQHVPDDNGIFVTRIIEGGAAYYDGRLQPMDKIVAVDHVRLDNVTHQFAVDTLKSTGNKVTIYFEKNPHPNYVPPPIEDSQSIQQFNQSGFGSQSHLAYTGAHPAPTQLVQPINYDPRVVLLRKSTGGLGFNIVGGEDGAPIYVSHVLPGGAADLSGDVRRGDVLLQVNDIDLRKANHAATAVALKNCPPESQVQLLLQYRPEEFSAFEQKIEALRNERLRASQQDLRSIGGTLPAVAPAVIGGAQQRGREVYVRALFDNDPSRDTGVPHRALAFKYGDILHVLNANDDDWWTARRVAENGDETQEGVIPSKRRVEKRERQRRKQVNFNAGSQSLGRNASMSGLEGRRGSRSQLSFSRKFPFVKSTEKLNEYTDHDLNTAEEPVHSYEPVELQNINYVRPVIILGSLKDRINDTLVSQFPNRFSSCVPHTSREPRENEVNGRDYYFVSKAEMEAEVRNNMFIEAGQFHDNLYGTSIKAVRDVANAGRHCILDVSGHAIRRLQNTAGIYPIAILVKPQNYHQLREWDPKLNDAEAGANWERIQRNEQTFGDLFTRVVQGVNFDDVLNKVIQTISENSQSRIWVPSKQPL